MVEAQTLETGNTLRSQIAGMEHYAPLALGPAIRAQDDFQQVITCRQSYDSGASAPIEAVPPQMSLGELQDIKL